MLRVRLDTKNPNSRALHDLLDPNLRLEWRYSHYPESRQPVGKRV
jgi:hypothetical protein